MQAQHSTASLHTRFSRHRFAPVARALKPAFPPLRIKGNSLKCRDDRYDRNSWARNEYEGAIVSADVTVQADVIAHTVDSLIYGAKVGLRSCDGALGFFDVLVLLV